MPCYDPETHERPIRLEKKVHKLTALLCYACGYLDEASPEVISANKDLLAWWSDHKTHDARVAAVKAKAAQFGDSSLSPEERGLLYTANDISYNTPPRAVVINQ